MQDRQSVRLWGNQLTERESVGEGEGEKQQEGIRNGVIMSPLQMCWSSSSWYPLWMQEQKYDPTRLLHTWLQPSPSSSHSLISGKRQQQMYNVMICRSFSVLTEAEISTPSHQSNFARCQLDGIQQYMNSSMIQWCCYTLHSCHHIHQCHPCTRPDLKGNDSSINCWLPTGYLIISQSICKECYNCTNIQK